MKWSTPAHDGELRHRGLRGNIRLTRIIESEAFQSIGDLIPYESFIYNLIIEKQL